MNNNIGHCSSESLAACLDKAGMSNLEGDDASSTALRYTWDTHHWCTLTAPDCNTIVQFNSSDI